MSPEEKNTPKSTRFNSEYLKDERLGLADGEIKTFFKNHQLLQIFSISSNKRPMKMKPQRSDNVSEPIFLH